MNLQKEELGIQEIYHFSCCVIQSTIEVNISRIVGAGASTCPCPWNSSKKYSKKFKYSIINPNITARPTTTKKHINMCSQNIIFSIFSVCHYGEVHVTKVQTSLSSTARWHDPFIL